MPTPQSFPAPEALLAHQQFLRAIVKSLLHGADGARYLDGHMTREGNRWVAAAIAEVLRLGK